MPKMRKNQIYDGPISRWLEKLIWESLGRGPVELYSQNNCYMNWSSDHWNVCTTLAPAFKSHGSSLDSVKIRLLNKDGTIRLIPYLKKKERVCRLGEPQKEIKTG